MPEAIPIRPELVATKLRGYEPAVKAIFFQGDRGRIAISNLLNIRTRAVELATTTN